MVKKNAFAILGKDSNSKKFQTEKIKSLLSKDHPDIGTILFFCKEAPSCDIRKEIENFSFSQRLFIFKDSQLLPEDLRSYMLGVLNSKPRGDYFIFDFDVESQTRQDLDKDKFFSFLFKINPPFKIAGRNTEVTLRDLAFALRNNSAKESLTITAKLFKDQNKERIAMQILGLIVKVFTDTKNPLLKNKYLKDIFAADRLIKQGQLNPKTALEVLILRLTLEGL